MNTTCRALLVGFSPQVAEAYKELLPRANRVVETCSNVDEAIARMRTMVFDLFILSHAAEEAAVARLARALRRPGGDNLRAGLVLITPPEQLMRASALVGHGVNKVLSTRESPAVVQCALLVLLASGGGASDRLMVGINVDLDIGVEQVHSTSVNISTTGMLVTSRALLDIGNRIGFRIYVPGDAIEGRGKVVRLTRPDEPVRGYGIRFTSFEGSGRSCIARYLEGIRRPIH